MEICFIFFKIMVDKWELGLELDTITSEFVQKRENYDFVVERVEVTDDWLDQRFGHDASMAPSSSAVGRCFPCSCQWSNAWPRHPIVSLRL